MVLDLGDHPSGRGPALQTDGEIAHVNADDLERGVTAYAIAGLVLRNVAHRALTHEVRLALAGYLLRYLSEDVVIAIGESIAERTGNDVRDVAPAVRSTADKLKRNEPVTGRTELTKAIDRPIVKRIVDWIEVDDGPGADALRLEDFIAYLPEHRYICIPTRDFWAASSVDSRVARPAPRVKPTTWLDRNRHVEQMTWCPGKPLMVENAILSDGGWIEYEGFRIFNLYREPVVTEGDPQAAGPWLNHLRRIYPDDFEHIVRWLAHRVQHPDQKLNHALVLGGAQGIGKDTLLDAVRDAVGPWNVVEVTPTQVMGRFNGWVKSIILRISEARDLGDVSRYNFYEHLKSIIAAPPEVLRVDEKNLREYPAPNVTGVVLTTNYKTAGIYLPPDDRRHYVAWSECDRDEFDDDYWKNLYAWYDAGGRAHVAAYLRTVNLATFDPKAPPPKTAAWYAIVDANLAPEENELADAIDKTGRWTA